MRRSKLKLRAAQGHPLLDLCYSMQMDPTPRQLRCDHLLAFRFFLQALRMYRLRKHWFHQWPEAITIPTEICWQLWLSIHLCLHKVRSRQITARNATKKFCIRPTTGYVDGVLLCLGLALSLSLKLR